MSRFKPVSGAGLCAGLLLMVGGMLGFSASAFAETKTFTPGGGSEQPFEVPFGDTTIEVTAIGGAGAEGPCGAHRMPGGAGAKVGATLAVKPGHTLYVDFGGGGRAGSTCESGPGGGASDVRSEPGGSALKSLESRLIVAGGGGAAGAYGGAGGNASGTTGEAGKESGLGGLGGTSTKGGKRR
jgi:hypothetical protein